MDRSSACYRLVTAQTAGVYLWQRLHGLCLDVFGVDLVGGERFVETYIRIGSICLHTECNM